MRILSDNIQMVYYIFCFIGYILAGSMFWRANQNAKKLVIRKKPLELVKDFMIKDIDQNEVNQIFKKTGIKANLIQYQIIRFTICWGWIFITIFSAIIKGVAISYTTPVLLVVLFFATAPSKKILKFKAPFVVIADFLIQYRQKQFNLEISRAMSQMKNLAITKADRPPGSTFIIEHLAKFADKTKPIIEKMQSMWNMGQKEKACDYFESTIGTPEAESFASILRKIDGLNPIELRSQMELFQEDFRRKRETARIKEDELKSNLIYSVIIVSIIAIFINFLVVGVFIDLLGGLRKI